MYGWCFDKRCCQGDVERIIVVCHDHVTTSAGTGSVTRLDESLAPIWTYNLGTDSGSSRQRRATCCKITSNGDIYVAWDVNSQGPLFVAGMLCDDQIGSTGYTAGGVTKLDKDGNLIGTYTHGARRSTYAPGSLNRSKIIGSVSVDVDPNDETKVWLGTIIDGSSDWLHLLDDTLSLISSFGAAEYSLSTTNAICSRIAVDNHGNCWNRVHAVSGSGPRINAIDSTGTVNYTGTTDMPGSCLDFDLDSVSDQIVFIRTYSIGVQYMCMRTFVSIANNDPVTWEKSYDDYIYTDFQGRWVTRNQITATAFAGNGRAMFHHTNPDLPHWEWPASTYHKDRNASLYRINMTSGVVEYAEVPGDTDGGNINKQNGNRCRLAWDEGLGNGGFLLAVFSRGLQDGVTDDFQSPVQERSFGASLTLAGSGFLQGSNAGVDSSSHSLYSLHWGDVRTIVI